MQEDSGQVIETIDEVQRVKALEEENAALRKENEFLKDSISSVKKNLFNLVGILDTISRRISNQILGNADVLKFQTAKMFENGIQVSDADGNPKEIKVFQSDNVENLICNPIQLILGRLGGLRKAMIDLKERV